MQISQQASKQIFELSKQFPIKEYYSLTNPLLYASRLVCVYYSVATKSLTKKEFIETVDRAKLEITKTQTWLKLAVNCNYIKPENAKIILQNYALILRYIDRTEKAK